MIKEFIEICNNCRKVVEGNNIEKRYGVKLDERFCSCGRNGGTHCCMTIRMPGYGKKINMINSLVSEAKREFGVKDEDIELVHYAGIHYKGTIGIEFEVDMGSDKLPDQYRRIWQSENLLQ